MVKLIQEYFLNSAERFPNKIAISYKDKDITYSELNTYTNKLANLLLKLGVVRNDRVAFCLYKSDLSIKSSLGILKADCCYVPLDARSPESRIKTIVEDCRPSVIICNYETIDNIKN